MLQAFALPNLNMRPTQTSDPLNSVHAYARVGTLMPIVALCVIMLLPKGVSAPDLVFDWQLGSFQLCHLASPFGMADKCAVVQLARLTSPSKTTGRTIP